MVCCRGFWECLLKLLNFILTVTGLAIVGYGIYLLVAFAKASDDDKPDISPTPDISPVSGDSALIQFGRPMLMAVSLSDNIFDKLPKAWYACLLLFSCHFWDISLCYVYHWLLCDSLMVLFFVIFCCISLLCVI